MVDFGHWFSNPPPAISILEPNSNPALYVAAVLTLYVDLPDTPLRASVPN
jgi:hypothetical protein